MFRVDFAKSGDSRDQALVATQQLVGATPCPDLEGQTRHAEWDAEKTKPAMRRAS